MENYILQILESNSRVIIPEFGAFIIKQKNPLTIIFNEFLQYNDGMLVDVISKKEGIDRDSAKQKIDDFVGKLNAELNSTGQYTLPGIGVVTKNTSGKISLEKEGPKKTDTKEPKPDANTGKKPVQAKETKKAVPKIITDIKEEPIEIVTEEPKKEIKVEKKAESQPKVEEKTKVDKEPPKTGEKKPEKSVISPKPAENKPETEKPERSVELEVTPKKVTEEKKTEKTVYEPKYPTTSSPKTENNTRSRTRLIIWLIIIIIVNGALIGYFIYSEEISSLFHKKSNAVTEEELIQENQLQPEIEPSEENFEDMVPAETIEEPVNEIKNVQKPVQSGTRFYVVAGVFGDENNADNLVIELRKKGFNAEKFGKIGKLHAVSYNVYSTKAEADRELRRIQNEIDPEAWIKEVK